MTLRWNRLRHAVVAFDAAESLCGLSIPRGSRSSNRGTNCPGCRDRQEAARAAVDTSEWGIEPHHPLAAEADAIAEAVADAPSKRQRIEILRRALARGADPEDIRDAWPSAWPRDGSPSTDRRFARDVAAAREAVPARRLQHA